MATEIVKLGGQITIKFGTTHSIFIRRTPDDKTRKYTYIHYEHGAKVFEQHNLDRLTVWWFIYTNLHKYQTIYVMNYMDTMPEYGK